MRDPNELEVGTNYMNQREAFSHQNDLNIRDLKVKREFMAEERDLSPQMKAAIRLNRQRNLKPQATDVYRLTGPEDKTLLFESKFECGNLYLAQKATENEYNLLM